MTTLNKLEIEVDDPPSLHHESGWTYMEFPELSIKMPPKVVAAFKKQWIQMLADDNEIVAASARRAGFTSSGRPGRADNRQRM